MDGPNYYIPTVENTANLAYIPLVCECGNDPSCVWDGVKWVKPSKWYNYV